MAWKILTSLPLSKKIQIQFKNLSYPIEQLLDISSVYRATYSLIVIQTLASQKSWIQKFYHHRGLNRLFEIFNEVSCESEILVPVFLSRILSVLEIVISSVSRALPCSMIEKLFDSLSLFADCSKEADSEHGSQICKSVGSLLQSAYQHQPE